MAKDFLSPSPVEPETVPPLPLSQPAHCQEVAPGDASRPTEVGMDGTLRWDMWEDWGGMGKWGTRKLPIMWASLAMRAAVPGFWMV